MGIQSNLWQSPSLKYRRSFPSITVKLTCTKGPPQLSGRNHLFRGPNELICIVYTSIRRSL